MAQEPAEPQCNYTCIIVPEDGVPEALEASTLEALMQVVYPRLVAAKKGWCYMAFMGRRIQISAASQVFLLKLPDGTTVRMEDPAQGVFDANNRFSTLRAT